VWLYAHSAIAALLAYLFAGLWSLYWLPLAVFVSHLVLDRWKSELGDTTRMFVLDQAGHLVVLVFVWAGAVGLPWIESGRWLAEFAAQPALWIYVLSYTAVFWPAGFFVAKFNSAASGRPADQQPGRSGLWVGRLERVLALTAVLLGRFEFAGLLLVAKALFVWREGSPNEHSENPTGMLLGTLMSFAVAVVVGALAVAVLGELPAPGV